MVVERPFNVAIVAPTCFYYQVPLFQELSDDPRIDLTVYFCSQEAFGGQDVLRAFQTDRLWGTEDEWLKGYDYKFLRNYSPRPSYFNWPFGLINFGIVNEIRKTRPDVVILMAWTNPTWYLAIMACLLFRVPFLYMTDTNIQAEPSKQRWKSWVKKVLLGKMIFPLCSGFLCAGTSNKLLYDYFGVPDRKLAVFAYSWGYANLLQVAQELNPQRDQIRANLGISETGKIIMYCGRLSNEKNPAALLRAYHQISDPAKVLIFVGDGRLRQELQEYIASNNIESVYFTGFQDRYEVSKFYAIADVLAVPSHREATGMVVYEGMNFGVPVVVSDQVGAGVDLVIDGHNGYTFHEGNEDELADRLQGILDLSEEERQAMGARSRVLISRWSDRDLSESLVQYLKQMMSRRKRVSA